ncbi:DUF1419 domain-containing protein [Bradyrhizobium sp. 142]|uniref:DUF1419 domain-containing protein n=1 Tax=Bradyrhizobium sp. 142 TaxID=2782618 RepID=UPI001FFB9235|nr:DUF1419 domain-containing protein [Bradyrhizobium sp. 142]MCK1727834.1 DUF1419 domain-containing protein [Bradyrhizobium sp. 142]
MTLSPIRKVYQGIADRRQMFRMFDRHAQRPDRSLDDGALYCGEWFEIGQAEHDYMFEILPPLWIRGDMFALCEFRTGSITSVFFALTIDGRTRYFHGYCDLSVKGSPDRMRAAIIERESRPVQAMTREERLEHIWSSTHDHYRSYAGDRWAEHLCGSRTVLFYDGRQGSVLKLLDRLTDAEIAVKLPVHLRHLPDAIAA